MYQLCFCSFIFSSTPRDETEGPASQLSKCYFGSFISASLRPSREEGCCWGGMEWRPSDWQAKLPAISNPLDHFSHAWHEIFSGIIPAVMKFLLKMSLEAQKDGWRKSQVGSAVKSLCTWVCCWRRLNMISLKAFVVRPHCWWESEGMNIHRTAASWGDETSWCPDMETSLWATTDQSARLRTSNFSCPFSIIHGENNLWKTGLSVFGWFVC